jgi:hypothetical protein
VKYGIIGLILFGVALLCPWWTLGIVMFVVGYQSKTNQEAMIVGISLPPLIWLIMFGIRYVSGGELILQRVTDMFNLHSAIWLVLASLIVPALTGFLSSLFGYQLREL